MFRDTVRPPNEDGYFSAVRLPVAAVRADPRAPGARIGHQRCIRTLEWLVFYAGP